MGIFRSKREMKKKGQVQTDTATTDLGKERRPFPGTTQEAVAAVKCILDTDDLETNQDPLLQITCIMITTIIDMQRFQEEIVPRLLEWSRHPESGTSVFPRSKRVMTVEDGVTDLLNGDILLFHDASPGVALTMPLAGLKNRAIEEPKTEKLTLGPKESYNEDFETNIGLLRRRSRDPNLVVRHHIVGQRSKTQVAVVYLRDVANPEWVEQIEDSIRQININTVMTMKDTLELLIGGQGSGPFPMYELSEVPAKTVSNLEMGRIAIFMEGSPYCAFLPTVLYSLLSGQEVLYPGSLIPAFIRTLKGIGIVLALYASSIYLALISVNTLIVPTEFGLAVAIDQSGIPYGPFFEVILFMIVLDLFVEATAIVPGNLGSAINLFGSLVIGEAASQAGLTSRLMIIVIAITVIGAYFASFQLAYAIRLWKYPLIVASALLGFYGITLITILLIAHLSGKKSFGIPYLAPFVGRNSLSQFGILFWEKNLRQKRKRLSLYKPEDSVRQKGGPRKR